jgi:hypothetical protein
VTYYPFQYALDKQKKSCFASLTVAEKWDWHADTYGFRRAFLDVESHITTSPCDPEGKWFDPARANAAEAHYRKKFAKPKQAKYIPPTADDIAYVEAVISTIRHTADAIKRIPTSPYDR